MSKIEVAPRSALRADLPLDGKVALVTGGSRGIGAAIVKRLAADGAAVAFTYAASPDKADEVVHAIEAVGGVAKPIRADAGKAEDAQRAVESTVAAFGRLDILVNNAGALVVKPAGEFTLEDFNRVIDVNVKGLFVATQEAVRHMKEGGRIINIGSVNAERVPFVGGGLYAMSKAAVVGLTRGWARDLGPRGITINNVQPGPVDTDMNPAAGPFAEATLPHMAIGRYGKVEEVADFVAYLASPGAGYITGANLSVDGGYTA
ncbi:MAG TPA: 3-oxoacyl-ACP reductase family protein [Candidatus Binatia bacterium]|nr:3-oxoacyl-ACP reductase family protein [Candidatus Binatia bacterium]